MVPIKLSLSFRHDWFPKSSSTCWAFQNAGAVASSLILPTRMDLSLKKHKQTHLCFQQFQEEENEDTSVQSDIFPQKSFLFLFIPTAVT